MSEGCNGFRITLSVRAPGAELEGASESGKASRASRVGARSSREEFAMREEKVEVLSARRWEVLELVVRGWVVNSDDGL